MRDLCAVLCCAPFDWFCMLHMAIFGVRCCVVRSRFGVMLGMTLVLSSARPSPASVSRPHRLPSVLLHSRRWTHRNVPARAIKNHSYMMDGGDNDEVHALVYVGEYSHKYAKLMVHDILFFHFHQIIQCISLACCALTPPPTPRSTAWLIVVHLLTPLKES